MEQTASKLWSKDFVLVLIGQIMSVFGGGVIRFSLPLHILYITGDAALLGLVMGLSTIPMVVMSPIGGALADRFRKHRIMLMVDVLTTVIIVLYILIAGMFTMMVPLVIITLMMINAANGMYAPTVESSVPVLVPAGSLVRANSAVMAVNTLSVLTAPAVAGVLLERVGVDIIIITGAIFFGITAIVDLFIRVPYKKQAAQTGVAKAVKSDISHAMRFVIKENTNIAKCAAAIFLPTLALNGALLVGLPVLITQSLGMSMEQMGISQSIMASGLLAGSIICGVLGSRLTVKKVYLPMLIAGLFLTPIGLVFLFEMPTFVAYVIITATGVIATAAVQPIMIPIYSFAQAETPVEVMGKVMSLLLMVSAGATAIGLLIFGRLYGFFAGSPHVVIFIAVFMIAAAMVLSRLLFRKTA